MRTVVTVLVLAASCICANASVAGVASSKQSLYAGDNFKCLDGSKSIAASKVNDDYCDCSDGSDEPGTSACANGQFYCTNEGFRGQYIPSSRVADGVCDCCDGSDEQLAKGSSCVNTCEEAGAAWRVAEAERIRNAEAGAKAKLVYIEQAKAALDGAGSAKAELEAREAAAAAELEAAETSLVAARAQAKTNALQRDADDAAVVLKSLELGDSSATELGALLVQLARTVKGGVRALSDLAEAAALKRGVEQKDIGRIVWPVSVPEDLKEEKDAAVKAAEGAVASARAEQRSAKDELQALESKKGKDYGPDNAFYPLDGKCVQLKQAQYTYHVCPFGSAKQDVTSLGTFEGFSDNYTTMRFTNGQTCWNGPARTMTVKLECGENEVLSAVDEPSKCEYTAKMTTPAVCDSRFAEPIDLQLEKQEL